MYLTSLELDYNREVKILRDRLERLERLAAQLRAARGGAHEKDLKEYDANLKTIEGAIDAAGAYARAADRLLRSKVHAAQVQDLKEWKDKAFKYIRAIGGDPLSVGWLKHSDF